MLLTRSRLCPRPKPGSSLHLHVLSTPPAFVLSQDQTLREELLTELSCITRGVRPYTRPDPDAIDEVLLQVLLSGTGVPSALTNLDAHDHLLRR